MAQYSRPIYQQEGYSWKEQQELSEATPPLSLKFALPSMPNVSSPYCFGWHHDKSPLMQPVPNNASSPPPSFAQRQTTMRTQVVPSSLHMVLQHWLSDFKAVSLSLQTQELQPETGLQVKLSKRLSKSTTAC